VAKRTGKTHENLENELTPPPVPRRPSSSETPRARVAAPHRTARERTGPIGISGGDFATPSARKRTTTQPRGVPVLGEAPVNGTPPPTAREGAQPESPFGAPTSADLGDAASRLAAEAAAVRAFDSGPLTPPPALKEDPGPTPPPVASASAVELAPSPDLSPADVAPPGQSLAPISDVEHGFGAAAPMPDVAPLAEPEPSAGPGEGALAALVGETSLPPDEAPASDVEAGAHPVDVSALGAEPLGDADGGELDVDTATDGFAAQETPWPELSAQGAAMRAPTPVPGAIPTDAMGGDSGRSASGAGSTPGPEARQLDDEIAGGDELELDGAEAAEALDTLPAEALSDAAPSAPEPPALRPAAAPPPLPVGSPRRKTGEMRAPEIPTAQVVASIVPPSPAEGAAVPEALAQRPRRPRRSKPWFEEVFDEDYLRTLPFMSAEQTLREVEFIEESLAVKPGGQVLDIGCGYGRHAIELVQRGLDVTGLDLSLPLLLRAADEAQKRAMSVNFVHADMREMAFEKQFDGAYSMLTSFGYFDEDTNLKVAQGIARALKAGGRFLLDLVNRDYVVGDLPSRVWWEGNGCVVLEEVDFNFHTSRILTHRSIVFEDGRQLEQEISVRAYSLHEIGRLLRQAGFRVIDISGSLATRGHFFGGTSRNLFILAEKRTDET
jgi:SAM-dependent methyltransferase